MKYFTNRPSIEKSKNFNFNVLPIYNNYSIRHNPTNKIPAQIYTMAYFSVRFSVSICSASSDLFFVTSIRISLLMEELSVLPKKQLINNILFKVICHELKKYLLQSVELL